MQSLGTDKSFICIDTRLNTFEKETLKIFNINHSESENFYTTDSDFTHKLLLFLQSIGNNDLKSVVDVKDIILYIVDFINNTFDEHYAWVQIRSQLPNDFAEIPRWHTDAKYISTNTNKYNSKFVISLKGATTLFAEFTSSGKDEYVAFHNHLAKTVKVHSRDTVYRHQMIAFLTELKQKSMASFHRVEEDSGCGCAFIHGGDMTKATVHSEPHVTKPRLFMSVLPMNKQNVLKLQTNKII